MIVFVLSSGLYSVPSGQSRVILQPLLESYSPNNAAQISFFPQALQTSLPKLVPLESQTVAIAAIDTGAFHNCALTGGGGVKCWGENSSGQLGDGTIPNSPPYGKPTPVDVIGLTSGVIAIAAGGSHTCALTIGGGVKCWGDNQYGQLGDGTISSSPPYGKPTPVDVIGLTSGVIAIAAGGSHTCALTIGGGVKCWGRNSSGQLGDGTISNTAPYGKPMPVDVIGLTSGGTAVSAGWNYTCALTTGGGAKCWGNNEYGQLGKGTIGYPLDDNTPAPVDVSGMSTGVKVIAAGATHACGATVHDGVKCWGYNLYGQLGDGTFSTSEPYAKLPVTVTGAIGCVTAMSGGNVHTCALIGGGGVKCWGENSIGELGDGTFDTDPPYGKALPVDVVGLTSSFISDICFRPNPDGYKFENYGGLTPTDYTVYDMRRMFGDSKVCWSVAGGICIPKLAALKWNALINKDMSEGHCDGMVSTSLRFFKGIDQLSPLQSDASYTHDLNLSNVRRHIAYYFALQYADPVSAYGEQVVNNPPSAILNQLRSAMSSGAPDPTTLFMFSGEDGHTVTPYAIQDLGGGTYHVLVYDSNWPDDASRDVEIDTTGETWSYDLGSGTIWFGNAGTKSLGVVPISKYAQPPLCPVWCASTNLASQSAASSLSQEVWLAGQGHLLITDAQGRHIGYVGNQFVNEIPGAYANPVRGGLGVHIEPKYKLPSADKYSILIDGQTMTQTQDVSVAQFGPGYAISADNILLGPSSQDTVTFASEGTQVSYRSNVTKPFTLTLALDGAAESNLLQIREAGIGAGQIVTLTANTSNGRLVFNNQPASEGTYTVLISRVSAAGQKDFLHAGIAILAMDTHQIDYGAWDGKGSITLFIDHGSDGSIDETIALTNKAQSIDLYLPLMVK